MNKAVAILVLVAVNLQLGGCLRCYYCLTENNPACLQPDVETLETVFCKKDQVCMKASHKVKSRTMVTRSCMYRNLSEEDCMDIPYTTDCVIKYCATNLCNGHRTQRSPGILALILPLFYWVALKPSWLSAFQ